MKKWYQESYFDRRNWLMENFDKLNLSHDETLFILLAEFAKQAKKNITYEYLMTKLSLSIKDIDKIISSLVEKHYLELSTNSKGLVFKIDNIFEFDPSKYEIDENKDVFDILSEVFGKPFSSNDLQKINDLLETYGKDKLLEATRIAEANGKLRLPYIEGILRNDK